MSCRCISVAKFAKEVIRPLVKEMDETSHMSRSLIKDMFDHGVSTNLVAEGSLYYTKTTKFNTIAKWNIRIVQKKLPSHHYNNGGSHASDILHVLMGVSVAYQSCLIMRNVTTFICRI